MATGHILPDKWNPVSSLRRAKSAYPLGISSTELNDFMAEPLDRGTFDAIRRKARDLWSQEDRERTTYNSFHNDQQLQGHAPPLSRPTSPTRKNKPHPPLVFLTCRLHHVPGCHNADAVLGKDVYRVDGSVPQFEQAYRDSLRGKYTTRPRTAAVMQYKSDQVEEDNELKEEKLTEGWLKLSNDPDKLERLNMFKTDGNYPRPDSKVSIPALRGYYKRAGYTEAKDWERYQDPENVAAVTRLVTPTVGEMRVKDIENKGKRPIFKSVTKRGDYLIHPEWPPTLRHHKLPCLC